MIEFEFEFEFERENEDNVRKKEKRVEKGQNDKFVCTRPIAEPKSCVTKSTPVKMKKAAASSRKPTDQ